MRELTTSANVGVDCADRRLVDAQGARRRPAGATVDQADELGTLFDLADRLSLGSSTAGATILVLDDDPSILTIVQFLLESEGVRIMTCDTPNELHQQLAATAPSLLVMDVRMGDVSGIELARELRTLPAYRDLPIVLISADTEAAHAGAGAARRRRRLHREADRRARISARALRDTSNASASCG